MKLAQVTNLGCESHNAMLDVLARKFGGSLPLNTLRCLFQLYYI